MTTYTLVAGENFITLTGATFSDSAEAAAVVAATFPKYSGVGVYRVTDAESRAVWYKVEGQVKILADKANGGTNETGLKRLKAMFRSIDKAGGTVELQPGNRHHTVASVEEFRTRYGA